MRLIYFGSGEFGLPTLQHLAINHDLVAVVTQPDRPAGRGRHLSATAIAQWAAGAGLTVLKADDVNTDSFLTQVKDLHPDAAVVIAFGQKLASELLDVLGELAVNLHGSLLPKYRGAAPINWSIINGEPETGLSVISLAQRMDSGLIFGQAATPIDPLETAGELHDRLAQMGPELIEKVLGDFEAGKLCGLAQEETSATRAPKLSKADAYVNFDASTAQVCHRVHGLTPWPGAKVTWHCRATDSRLPLILRRVCQVDAHFDEMAGAVDGTARTVSQSEIRNPKSLPAPGTILQDHCVAVRSEAIRLLEVQLPGNKTMTIEDFTRGHQLSPGDLLQSDKS